MVKQKFVSGKSFDSTLLVQFIAVVVFIIGFIVSAGWISGVLSLTRVTSSTISMKFLTAMCFVLSGVLLYFFSLVKSTKNKTMLQVIIFNASIFLMLLMGTATVAIFFGVSTGIENIVIKEIEYGAETTFLGAPSVFTAIAFTLFSFAGMVFAFDLQKRIIFWVGAGIVLIGAIALLGYLFGLPMLYYDYPKITNPIAINTAFTFVLLGIGLILLSKGWKNED